MVVMDNENTSQRIKSVDELTVTIERSRDPATSYTQQGDSVATVSPERSERSIASSSSHGDSSKSSSKKRRWLLVSQIFAAPSGNRNRQSQPGDVFDCVKIKPARLLVNAMNSCVKQM